MRKESERMREIRRLQNLYESPEFCAHRDAQAAIKACEHLFTRIRKSTSMKQKKAKP